MAKLDISKKTSGRHGDWPSYKVVYELRKCNTSCSRIARLNGYARSSGRTALYIPWPQMEKLIAKELGVQPRDIWPSRYHADGTPKSARGARGLGRYRTKNSTSPLRVNVEKHGTV